MFVLVLTVLKSEEGVFFKKGPPVTSTIDPLKDGSRWKSTTLVMDQEHFIPTKFHQNPSSGSGEEVENAKVYGRRRRTDGALW